MSNYSGWSMSGAMQNLLKELRDTQQVAVDVMYGYDEDDKTPRDIVKVLLELSEMVQHANITVTNVLSVAYALDKFWDYSKHCNGCNAELDPESVDVYCESCILKSLEDRILKSLEDE